MSELVYKVGFRLTTGDAGLASLVPEEPWRKVYVQGAVVNSDTPLFVFQSLQAAQDFAREDPHARHIWAARTPQTFEPPLYLPHSIGHDMTSEGWLEFWTTWNLERNTTQFFRQGWQRDITAVPQGTRICNQLEVLYEVCPVDLAAYRALISSPQAPGTIAVAVFSEQIIMQTVRMLLGLRDIAHLDATLDYVWDCCLDYEIIPRRGYQAGTDMRYLAFYFEPLSIQSVVFRAMEMLEMQWQQKHSASISYDMQEAELFRTLVDQAVASIRPPTLTRQQAFVQLLPCGPYMTARGPVVVRWNNTCCSEVCPFCGEDFKPSWGLWAFLFGLGGPVVCLECWHKGNSVQAATGAPTISANPTHQHELESDDSHGCGGICACGAYWTFEDGWWRQDTAGTWCRETSSVPSP